MLVKTAKALRKEIEAMRRAVKQRPRTGQRPGWRERGEGDGL